jgi:hypothetical protein
VHAVIRSAVRGLVAAPRLTYRVRVLVSEESSPTVVVVVPIKSVVVGLGGVAVAETSIEKDN